MVFKGVGLNGLSLCPRHNPEAIGFSISFKFVIPCHGCTVIGFSIPADDDITVPPKFFDYLAPLFALSEKTQGACLKAK